MRGTCCERLGGNLNQPFAIAVDPKCVYWTSKLDGTVMKVAL